MALKNCNICFDKPVFLSGETVTGKVNLTLEKNKLCTGAYNIHYVYIRNGFFAINLFSALILNIFGEAYCKLSISHGRGKPRIVLFYKADEVYFETFNNLMAEQYTEGNFYVNNYTLIYVNIKIDFSWHLRFDSRKPHIRF